ncbi:MAG: hypothetical protein ACKOB9_07225 [Solirubrobacterales bacterium]
MTRSTALIIALVIAGGAVAALILVNGGGSGSSDAPTVATTPPVATTEATATTTTTSNEPETVQVEATVTSYVSAAEEGDATAVCNLQVDGQGSGATSAQACASKAGIDIAKLPALSRLKVQDVKVDGDRATASLGRFGEFSLQKSGGQWKVSGFKAAAAAPSAGAGGTSGGSTPGSRARERQDSGGAAAPSGTGGASAP